MYFFCPPDTDIQHPGALHLSGGTGQWSSNITGAESDVIMLSYYYIIIISTDNSITNVLDFTYLFLCLYWYNGLKAIKIPDCDLPKVLAELAVNS